MFVGEQRRLSDAEWAVVFIGACSEENNLIPQIVNGNLSISAVVELHESMNCKCLPNSKHLSKFVYLEKSA